MTENIVNLSFKLSNRSNIRLHGEISPSNGADSEHREHK